MEAAKRKIVMALMVAMFLGAVEGTVVTTAIPTIARDLKGFELISWIFSLYLLTSAITTPIYGKLSDLFGRKNILSIGILIFIIGSSLCGLSQNMYQLIAFRLLQGIGAGAIFTVTYTIVGDIFSLEERAKVQGYISTVWGIASLTGPFLGGFLIDYLSWHWIFFINIPFGIISIFLLQKNLQENFQRKKHKIDYAGAVALSVAILLLLNGVLTAGNNNNWYSLSVLLSLTTAFALLIAFYFIEKHAEEAMVPFDIFTRTNTLANIISLLASAVLIGADVYLPIYIQNILGFSATISGLSLAPMSLAWLTSSIILGKAIPRFGERSVTVISATILLLSCLLLPGLGIHSPLILVIIYSFILGFSFGGSFTTLTIVVQSSVEYNKRGAATASNSLLRTLGQAIGVSVFGSIFNMKIVNYFSSRGIVGVDPDSLYSGTSVSTGISYESAKASIISGMHVVFTALIFLAIFCLLLSFALPNKMKVNS